MLRRHRRLVKRLSIGLDIHLDLVKEPCSNSPTTLDLVQSWSRDV